jgi:hypothetical protein
MKVETRKMAVGQAGAPLGNKNRAGKGTKKKKRVQISMSISDHSQISDGIYADLRGRFEHYLLDRGIPPTEEEIKSLARQWAYENWWHRLKTAEDDLAMIL